MTKKFEINLIGGKRFDTDNLEAIETGYTFKIGNTEYEIPWTSVLYIKKLLETK